ncbi:RHS repeat domain-containing protein [Chryseobacterium gambrini]|uniref:RHS repeat domain-containing protein n=1 Tax=Chryseobacterium gambrini TaxID=373672 RepID=UPI0022F1D9C0|nr:RHS repeat-associated core domain-containing protein [Chryseobacterium gambrini]WBV53485.1 RHS repeat-associated core domain-containing protein [Chryseobacterium gambrini]
MNRLLAGFYQKDTNPSAKEYFEKMEYDLNGNISNLKRSAQSQQGASAFNIDDLGYIYTGNRLTSVTDSSTDYRGYPDTSGNTISYDLNGNMKDHKDKGILQIDYNFLNLPKYIKFSDFASYDRSNKVYVNTNYLYRADGSKIRKVHNYKDPSYAYALGTRTTDYLDGFQYEYDWTPLSGIPTNDFQLKFVPTSEGYFDFVKNKYIYNYTDHLGNIRLSYFNSESGAEVLEENNYYPFGMKHEGYNTSFSFGSSYQYKYNGKELQTESGMYDYGARFYMADIGRWGVVDPATELGRRFSPYNYAFDNPIMFVDPDGMWPWPTWNQVKSFGRGAWNATKGMVKGTLEGASLQRAAVIGTVNAMKTYKAFRQGGVKAAVKQATNIVYEETGTKALVQTGKGVAKGDAESIGSATVMVIAAVTTHKVMGAKAGKVATATETSTTSLEGAQLSRSQMSTVVGGGGAERAAQFSSQWESASLSETIQKIAPEAEGTTTATGKTIYNNSETGLQVVYDNTGNYFRIEDTNLSGRRTYLDLEGNVPNNKTVNGKQMGRSQAEYNQVTHFNNID